MNNDINFELIKYYIDELTKMFEQRYPNRNEKQILFHHKMWLKQYSMVLDYLENHPDVGISDIKNNYIEGSFNPASWIAGQKALETKGKLLLYRQHLLIMGHFPLKLDRESYKIIDPRKPIVFPATDINTPALENEKKKTLFIKAREFIVDKMHKK